jgi:hypothetical protein
MNQLLQEIDYEYIPAAIGGGLQLYNEPYTFNLSETGPLYYPGCEQDALEYIEKRKHFERYDSEEYCYYFSGVTPQDSIYSNTNQFDSTRTNFSPGDSENSPVDESTARIAQETPTSTETSAKDLSDSEDVSSSQRSFPAISHDLSHRLQPSSGIAEVRVDTNQEPTQAVSFGASLPVFVSYSLNYHPLLFCLMVVLLFFITTFHPLILKSSLPSMMISLVFMYCLKGKDL